MLIAAIVALAVGTYSMRLGGALLGGRLKLPDNIQRLLPMAAAALLAALAGTATLMAGQAFAGVARPAGVLVGGILAWRKAPFVVVVLAAAATAALLRLAGVPVLGAATVAKRPIRSVPITPPTRWTPTTSSESS